MWNFNYESHEITYFFVYVVEKTTYFYIYIFFIYYENVLH